MLRRARRIAGGHHRTGIIQASFPIRNGGARFPGIPNLIAI